MPSASQRSRPVVLDQHRRATSRASGSRGPPGRLERRPTRPRDRPLEQPPALVHPAGEDAAPSPASRRRRRVAGSRSGRPRSRARSPSSIASSSRRSSMYAAASAGVRCCARTAGSASGGRDGAGRAQQSVRSSRSAPSRCRTATSAGTRRPPRSRSPSSRQSSCAARTPGGARVVVDRGQLGGQRGEQCGPVGAGRSAGVVRSARRYSSTASRCAEIAPAPRPRRPARAGAPVRLAAPARTGR